MEDVVIEDDDVVPDVAGKTELEVLLEQLDELRGEGVTSGEDALEYATVAGLAARLDPPPGALEDAERWLREGGRELVAEGLEEVDLEEIVDVLNHLEGADEEEIDEAFADFDDIVAAAVWAGHADRVRPAARRVARLIRQVPDPFVFMAPTGKQVARSRVVALDIDIHDYWLAIAESEAWSEGH